MLVPTLEILKKYIPTITADETDEENFDKYESFVEDANTWLKREVIGSTLYAVIKDLLEDDATHAELVKRANKVVAHKSYIDSIPFNDLIETASGFAVIETDTKAPASAKRVEKLVDANKKKLSDAVDELIEYLEETTAYHDDWKGSPTYSLLTDTFIHTLREFRQFAPFEGNRTDWIRDKMKMFSVINLRMAPVISQELCDQIIEQQRDGDLTAANLEIIQNCKYAAALFFVGEEKSASSYLFRIRKTCTDNLDSYPAFRDSALYAKILAQTTASNSGAIFRTAL